MLRGSLVRTHLRIQGTENELGDAYMTLGDGERSGRHMLKALELMKAVYYPRAPMVANMQLSLQRVVAILPPGELSERLSAAAQEGRDTLMLHYGTDWRQEYAADGLK